MLVSVLKMVFIHYDLPLMHDMLGRIFTLSIHLESFQ
jgi:hypothetical protein